MRLTRTSSITSMVAGSQRPATYTTSPLLWLCHATIASRRSASKVCRFIYIYISWAGWLFPSCLFTNPFFTHHGTLLMGGWLHSSLWNAISYYVFFGVGGTTDFAGYIWIPYCEGQNGDYTVTYLLTSPVSSPQASAFSKFYELIYMFRDQYHLFRLLFLPDWDSFVQFSPTWSPFLNGGSAGTDFWFRHVQVSHPPEFVLCRWLLLLFFN